MVLKCDISFSPRLVRSVSSYTVSFRIRLNSIQFALCVNFCSHWILCFSPLKIDCKLNFRRHSVCCARMVDVELISFCVVDFHLKRFTLDCQRLFKPVPILKRKTCISYFQMNGDETNSIWNDDDDYFIIWMLNNFLLSWYAKTNIELDWHTTCCYCRYARRINFNYTQNNSSSSLSLSFVVCRRSYEFSRRVRTRDLPLNLIENKPKYRFIRNSEYDFKDDNCVFAVRI